jgi:hypothetical protein
MTDLMVYLTTGLASFIFLFIKSFQYRNVAFDRLFSIIPTSVLMAFAEYYTIYMVVTRATYDIPLVFVAGLMAGIGSTSATMFHKYVYDKIDARKRATSTAGR